MKKFKNVLKAVCFINKYLDKLYFGKWVNHGHKYKIQDDGSLKCKVCGKIR